MTFLITNYQTVNLPFETPPSSLIYPTKNSILLLPCI